MLLDGANSVSGQSRAAFPAAPLSTALALVAFAAALVLLRRGRRRAVALVLLAALAPGAVWVLALRADAPHRRGELARSVASAVARVQRAAPWPGAPVEVAHEDDDVLFPIGRYALPSRPPAPAAGQLELRGTSLSFDCVAGAGRTTVCGAPGR